MGLHSERVQDAEFQRKRQTGEQQLLACNEDTGKQWLLAYNEETGEQRLLAYNGQYNKQYEPLVSINILCCILLIIGWKTNKVFLTQLKIS